jgi:hypothetical protein
MIDTMNFNQQEASVSGVNTGGGDDDEPVMAASFVQVRASRTFCYQI